MIKILFIIPSLKAYGGSERIISEIANYSSLRKNIEVHLVLLIKGEKFYELNKTIILHEPSFNHKEYPRIVFTLKILKYLRNLFRKIKPDAVLSFDEMYNSFVLLASLFLNIRIFISDRSQPGRDWGIFHNNLKKVLYPASYGIIAQTLIAKEILYKQTKHKNIIVIPNPIKQINAKSELKEKIILNVGRLIKSKRQDLLLRIFSRTNNVGWKLFIAGDGPEKENLVLLAKSLGIIDQVIFVGNIKNIESLYIKSRIFAFTSNSEGFPNALGEAMSASNAVISFNCVAGPSELIEDGISGFLIKEDNIEEYIFKLQLLMYDETICKSFGEKAREKVKELSIEIIGNKFIKTLTE